MKKNKLLVFIGVVFCLICISIIYKTGVEQRENVQIAQAMEQGTKAQKIFSEMRYGYSVNPFIGEKSGELVHDYATDDSWEMLLFTLDNRNGEVINKSGYHKINETEGTVTCSLKLSSRSTNIFLQLANWKGDFSGQYIKFDVLNSFLSDETGKSIDCTSVFSEFKSLYFQNASLAEDTIEIKKLEKILSKEKWDSYTLYVTLAVRSFPENLMDYLARTDRVEYYLNASKISEEDIINLKKAGFNVIRFPITFSLFMDENKIIFGEDLDRIKEIVSYCTENEVYCILNSHFDCIGNTAIYDIRVENKQVSFENFEILWRQLAETFKDYNDYLIFEGWNEAIYQDEWVIESDNAKKSCEVLNELAQFFVDVVRETGGNNKERILLLSPYAQGAYALKYFKVPNDPSGVGYILMSCHSYYPTDFTNPSFWNVGGNDEAKSFEDIEWSALESQMEFINQWSKKNNIPFIYGEYAAYDKNNTEDRVLWYKKFNDMAVQYGIKTVAWGASEDLSKSDDKGMALYNFKYDYFYYPQIVNAITGENIENINAIPREDTLKNVEVDISKVRENNIVDDECISVVITYANGEQSDSTTVQVLKNEKMSNTFVVMCTDIKGFMTKRSVILN